MENKESETLMQGSECNNVGEIGIASEDGVENSDQMNIDPENKLFPHAPNSPTKIEVCGNDIKLSVDVFGPSDCNNETLQFVVKNENGDGKIDGKEECALDVGDLVWIKTRTKVWWPGVISDPADADEHGNVSGKKKDFLVKHFGNGRFVWCSNSELRPFIEHFEQFSATNDSNNFNGSVEKALCEVSRRVRSKMSCSCFEKGNQKEPHEKLMLTEKVSDFEIRSLPQFNPESFLANVQRLASTGSIPSKVDFIIMKDCLSAFYHSVGRCHVPLHLLIPGSEVSDYSQDNDVSECKSKKRNHAVKTGKLNLASKGSETQGSETRSRKKSKYLSYPYVTAKKEIESNSGDDTEKPSSVGKKSGKKGTRKNLKVSNTVSKEDKINASSAELLYELRANAVDCSHHISKYSDSLKRFYCSFRKFSFLDTIISSKLVKDQIEDMATMEEFDQGVDIELVKQGLSISERDTAIHMEGKGAGKKEEACLESKDNSLAMDSDISPIIKPCSSDMSKKRKGIATREPPQHDMLTEQQYLSGEPSSVNQQGQPLPENLNGSVVSQNINDGTSSLLDVQVNFDNISQLNTGVGLNGTRKIQSGGFIFEEPNAGTINFGLASSHVQNMLQMGGLLHPSSVKPEPEIQTNEKTTQVASSIPDLNGNVLSEGYTVPVSAEGGPQLKKASEEPGSSVKKRVLNIKEDPGAGLLLKFTPDFPLPSKETLITTFSRFGLLKESEIQILDSCTTQIMYERSSDAKFAFRSLEKSSPFGASLASFNLHGMPAVDPKPTIVRKRKVVTASQQKQPSNKKAGVMKGSPSVDPGDVGAIKQNVEMMKSALEKAGDTVSPEMRAKLESEIKSFLDKFGSSSSS